MTYQRTLFPDPADHRRNYCIGNGKRYEGDIRTQTMDPHKRTRRFPTHEGTALLEPRGRALVMYFEGDILVYPRIRGRQPTVKVVLELVTYEVVSVYTPRTAI